MSPIRSVPLITCNRTLNPGSFATSGTASEELANEPPSLTLNGKLWPGASPWW